jgi:hypothetical protein
VGNDALVSRRRATTSGGLARACAEPCGSYIAHAAEPTANALPREIEALYRAADKREYETLAGLIEADDAIGAGDPSQDDRRSSTARGRPLVLAGAG